MLKPSTTFSLQACTIFVCHTKEMLRNRYLIQFQYLYLSSLVYREHSVNAGQISFIKLFWRTANTENLYNIALLVQQCAVQ